VFKSISALLAHHENYRSQGSLKSIV